MLNIEFIRTHQETMKEVVTDKNCTVSIEELLDVDSRRKALRTEVEAKRAQRNAIAEQMKRAGSVSLDEKQKWIEEGKALKTDLSIQEDELRNLDSTYQKLMYQVPNTYSSDTPIGKDDSENVIIKTVGEPRTFSFAPKEHWQLGQEKNLINTEASAQISGSRFAYLMGDLVRLQFALVQFAFDVLGDVDILTQIAKNADLDIQITPFTPVVPPMMMRPEIMEKMGRLHPIDDRYQTTEDGLMLIGSAEHTLGPLHMNTTFSQEQLPIRYVGYSTAFRREAGTYGKDMKGILRLHQFDKLEIETFVTADQGAKEQEFIIAIQEYLMQELGLSYQLSLKCTGDMGTPNRRAVDVETWLPGQDTYRETHTSDYMADFQARRLSIQYLDTEHTKRYVHMNDATVFGIGRMIIAIMENYQQEDGSIEVPHRLVRYLGKTHI